MINIKSFLSKKTLIFIAIFTTLGLIAMQAPITQLAGSKAKFTLFDCFGPISGAFIGTAPGIIAVFLMQIGNFLIHGAKIVDAGTIIRFFPMLFAVLYFAKKSRLTLIVPAAAIIAFNLHPIGRSAWIYSLYWMIPIAAYFFRDRFLFARALGATFTAHAVGGALWIYAFGLSREIWLSLIPITFMERMLFAVGICAVYLIFNNLLNYLMKKKLIQTSFLIEKKYLLPV